MAGTTASCAPPCAVRHSATDRRHTRTVTPPPADRPAVRGVVRLLNTSGGRLLCLAGDVDATAVQRFVHRYGREPARIDRIDTGSATVLSRPALELLLDHLDAAALAGRPVAFSPTPDVERLLAAVQDRAGQPGWTQPEI